MRLRNFWTLSSVVRELWFTAIGRYAKWETIIKINRLAIVIARISFIVLVVSAFGLFILWFMIASNLTSDAYEIFRRMSAWRVFTGDYWELIEHQDFRQDSLVRFSFFTIFSYSLFWSMIALAIVWALRIRNCYSIYVRDKSRYDLCKSLGLSSYPKLVVEWFEGQEEVKAPEPTIELKDWVNQLLELQKFPNIKEGGKRLLEIINLKFSYTKQKNWFRFKKEAVEENVLKGMNVQINAGTFTTILGCNGSSKSTLIKAIINLFENTSGRIMWIGKDIKEISSRSFYQHVAYVGQSNIIQSQITVYDYVACGLFPSFNFFRFSYSKNEPIILENLKKLGILQHKDRGMNSLSGGERQKAILARVLTQGTEVIILDEPTSYLDIQSQYAILQILDNLKKKEGKTIITILHDIHQAKQFSDEVIIVDRGEIFAYGKTEEIITKENMEKIFRIPWN